MDKKSKIGILGGGVEGLAAAAYLAAHGYRDVTLYDENTSLEDADGRFLGGTGSGDGALSGPPPVPAVLGMGAFDEIDECDTVFRSPGVHPDKLKGFGGEITSTIRFFMEKRRGVVIGVTGTKGKGTTSALIYEILQEDGRDAYLGGNIGESPLKFLDDLNDDSLSVLELSSFQLQDLTVSPDVAVVLMTTSDHMDYHKDKDDYWMAKTPIARFQGEDGVLIVNSDYDYAEAFLALGKGKKVGVSTKGMVEKGAFLSNGKILYMSCDGGMCRREVIGETARVGLPGPHNLENVLAAVCVARSLGVGIDVIQKVIYRFSGLEHRLELVREAFGVKFYNDSFSTTPETCVAAARAFDAPTFLICGGSEKFSDYSDWARELEENMNVKAVFLIGDTAARMEEALKMAAMRGKVEEGKEFPLKVYMCGNLENALKEARAQARAGDYVIMSPAAASFGLFKNYKERGKRFRELVRAL
ncbi:UDP-N-acetylmuramoyl-L-alanine--D-glutamate ligase [Patescibacteria group bacterium]|nr:UDP-N-acetylmuramoyl-L-alanine--D-glutamate ligase [Patescibacteria group bacterium]MBU1954006.1 UDP-N-acetylmuramoyl-L-alanine--D-glutamate ligase [Patescibacteria group bacterium]